MFLVVACFCISPCLFVNICSLHFTLPVCKYLFCVHFADSLLACLLALSQALPVVGSSVGSLEFNFYIRSFALVIIAVTTASLVVIPKVNSRLDCVGPLWFLQLSLVPAPFYVS